MELRLSVDYGLEQRLVNPLVKETDEPIRIFERSIQRR
jgi:hypothetical protein